MGTDQRARRRRGRIIGNERQEKGASASVAHKTKKE
jgi:hypothetical protein